MQYYLVVRWGSPDEADRYDGRDTIFLVAASNRLAADKLVQSYLIKYEVDKDFNKLPNVIVELGKIEITFKKAFIVQGPYLDHFCLNVKEYSYFVRDYMHKNWHRIKPV